MRYFVTGGAGFIGSNVVDRLIQEGHEVVVYDNLVTGQERFLEHALASGRCHFVRGDLLDLEALTDAIDGSEFVFHLAANADVRFGLDHPRKDLEQNTIATFHVLEAMRARGVRRLAFSSTGSIYGEPEVFPTPEDAPMPVQTSLYGASKLAGEGLIQAYCHGYGFQALVFRFVSILGERYTHGHVFDFVRSLRQDATRLQVLGDGRQRKSYLYIGDCIDAMQLAITRCTAPLTILNLGHVEACHVDDSVAWICRRLQVDPVITHTGGVRGWVGDSPRIHLDCRRVGELGWRPRLSIQQAVERTVDYLQREPWVFGARES